MKKKDSKVLKFFNKIKKNNFIKKIINSKKKIFNNISKKEIKIKKSLAVDIGSSSIKIVQFSKVKGVAVLDTFGEIALGPFVGKPVGLPVVVDVKIITKALNMILNASASDSFNVSYCVSPNQSFNYILKKDHLIKNNISDVVIKDIINRFDINISEYDIEAKNITRQYDDSIRYEVTGIKKKIVEYNKILSKKLRLNIRNIVPEVKSIIYAVRHFFPNDYLVIDIGSSTTKIYMISKDTVYCYDIIDMGIYDILSDFNFNKKEEKMNFVGDSINSLFSDKIYEKFKKNEKSKNLDMIIIKINEFLKKFEISESKFVEDIILTGGGALFNGLEEFLSKKLDRKVVIANPFKKVKNPNFVNDKLKEVGPEYTSAIGLALNGLNE